MRACICSVSSGRVQVHTRPLLLDGRPLDDELFFEEPSELLGCSFTFGITIVSAEIDMTRHTVGVYCVFETPFGGEDGGTDKDGNNQGETLCQIREGDGSAIRRHTTAVIKGTLTPRFDAEFQITLAQVTQEQLEWLEGSAVYVRMFAKHASENMGGSSMLKKRAPTNQAVALDATVRADSRANSATAVLAVSATLGQHVGTQTVDAAVDSVALSASQRLTKPWGEAAAVEDAAMQRRVAEVSATLAAVEREHGQLSAQLHAVANLVKVRDA